MTQAEYQRLIDNLRSQLGGALDEIERLKALLPKQPFDVRCANALADEVAVLIRRQVLDMRSPAADALLDYRNPPSTPRSDRLVTLEAACTAFESNSKEASEVFEVLLVNGLVPVGKPGPRLAQIVRSIILQLDEADRRALRRDGGG